MKKLVYDLGCHNGSDTDFYLFRGFRVIAIEANPLLAQDNMKRFASAISSGDLVLLNVAVSDVDGEREFFIHPEKSDWSSCSKSMAESDGTVSTTVKVQSKTIASLMAEYGVPYYMKVDIEGYDLAVAKALFDIKDKPPFVSFELSKSMYAELFAWLLICGYKRFQLVNQANHPQRQRDDQYRFGQYSSGSFGDDLPGHQWLTYEEAMSRYIKYRELKSVDNVELTMGWLDLHASLL